MGRLRPQQQRYAFDRFMRSIAAIQLVVSVITRSIRMGSVTSAGGAAAMAKSPGSITSGDMRSTVLRSTGASRLALACSFLAIAGVVATATNASADKRNFPFSDGQSHCYVFSDRNSNNIRHTMHKACLQQQIWRKILV
jgi:hypothetical protein